MKKTYKLENLCCAGCASSIENSVGKIPGVEKVTVAFMLQKMIIEADDALFPELNEKIRAICKRIEPKCEVK